MTTQNPSSGASVRAPQRRDISARQDLLGKELRQLFDDYVQEDVPDELMRLALELQGAMETRKGTAGPPAEGHPGDGALPRDGGET